MSLPSSSSGHNMKIVSWNVNGIRSLKGDFRELLDSFQADILCFQETKITRDMIDDTVALIEGYNAYFGFSRKRSGYSGVVTYCKDRFTPFKAEEGLGGVLPCAGLSDKVGHYEGVSKEFDKMELQALDGEGRCIITQHKIVLKAGDERTLTIFNVYCPRADPQKPDRRIFKIRYYKLLQLRVEAQLNEGNLVIVVGDINTAHKPIDHCNPDEIEEFENDIGRKWLDEIIVDINENQESASNKSCFQLHDSFRYFHPNEKNAFTCWCTKLNARSTNYGTRIDYILTDQNLIKDMCDSVILKDIEGSDHCPIQGTFQVQTLRSSKCALLCAKLFPELCGTQQKLLKYFSKASAQRQLREMEKESQESEMRHKADLPSDSRRKKQSRKWTKASTSRSQKSIMKFLEKIPPSSNPKDSDLIERENQNNSEYNNDAIPGCSKTGTDIIDTFCVRQDSNSEFSSSDSPAGSDLTPRESCRGDSQTKTANALPTETDYDNLANVLSISEESVTNSNTPPSKSENGNERKTESGSKPASSAWKALLSGPKPPPKCKGHREPCILRTVKKPGPNQNRRFYCCARGEGHKDDPEARCNHFQWL